jgi:hypothetical protein
LAHRSKGLKVVELKDYRTSGRHIWTNGSTVRGRKPHEKSVAHERMRFVFIKNAVFDRKLLIIIRKL